MKAEPIKKIDSWGTITHAFIPGVGIIKMLKNGKTKLLKGNKIKDAGIEIEIKGGKGDANIF